jgi:hypothetical protein
MQKQYAYFSAAIRDGAKLRPQAVEGRGFSSQYARGESCGIAAGLEALYGREVLREDLAGKRVFEAFPYMDRHTVCPIEGCEFSLGFLGPTLYEVTWHLNDEHHWTREAIADWLFLEEEKLGFVTLTETEAHKPSVGFHLETVKATV